MHPALLLLLLHGPATKGQKYRLEYGIIYTNLYEVSPKKKKYSKYSKVHFYRWSAVECTVSVLCHVQASFRFTCCSVTVGRGTGAGEASSTVALVMSSLTLLPHCRSTWATCSLPKPYRSVSPIRRMWSPLRKRPSCKRAWMRGKIERWILTSPLNN